MSIFEGYSRCLFFSSFVRILFYFLKCIPFYSNLQRQVLHIFLLINAWKVLLYLKTGTNRARTALKIISYKACCSYDTDKSQFCFSWGKRGPFHYHKIAKEWQICKRILHSTSQIFYMFNLQVNKFQTILKATTMPENKRHCTSQNVVHW